ncbi:response regulator [Thermosulfuriphilus sp.]
MSYLVFLIAGSVFSIIFTPYLLRKQANILVDRMGRYILHYLNQPAEVALLTGISDYLETPIKGLFKDESVLGVVIYGKEGQVVYVKKKLKYKDPVLMLEDFKDEENTVDYFEPKLRRIRLFIEPVKSSPLSVELTESPPELLGFVRVDVSLEHFLGYYKEFLVVVILTYSFLAGLAALLAYYQARQIASPLRRLVEGARRLRAGDFDVRVPEDNVTGEIAELIETFNNMVEDLRRREEALRESEERFRTVAEFTYDWEYWRAPDGGFIYVSPACERITGYPPEAFLRDPELYNRIIHPDDWLKVQEHRQAKRNPQGEPEEIDFRIIRADGTERWIGHVCQAVYGKDGRYLGIRGSNRDITSRKELEERILRTQKMESIARLAGGVAHDLNNLMTAVLGQAELLRLALPEDSPLADRADKIITSAMQASGLAQQLLAYARGGKYAPKVINLNQTVKDVIKLNERSIGHNIELEVDLEPDLWPVYADPSQMAQVVMNLVINAVEAMEEGGKLIIRTFNSSLDTPCGDISAGRYVILEVTDTGHGMDKETLGNIFEPFFTTKFTGRGLGLAAVYGIVTNHGGYIQVDSSPGKGTSFFVYLPGLDPEATANETAAEIEEKEQYTCRILVIDDDPAVLEVIKEYLEPFGFIVDTAQNAREALYLVGKKPALILLDIAMPETDGVELYPLLRKAVPEARIIICTGYSSDGPAKKLLSQGADGFIQKPFTQRHLISFIRKHLRNCHLKRCLTKGKVFY